MTYEKIQLTNFQLIILILEGMPNISLLLQYVVLTHNALLN